MRILKHLMKSQNWTALQTLKAVNTPEEKISDYLALLEKNKNTYTKGRAHANKTCSLPFV